MTNDAQTKTAAELVGVPGYTEPGWITNMRRAGAVIRQESFAESSQLSLGELIDKVSVVPPEWDKASGPDDYKHVRFDFGYFFPTRMSSWRGLYSELAIEFMDGDEARELYAAREKNKVKDHQLIKEPSVTEFLAMLNAAVGQVFTGYKGGDHVMTRNTPVWVANSGDANNTAVVDVFDEGYGLIIQTRWLPTW